MKLGFENLYSIAVALYRGIRHSTDTHTDAQSAKKDVISTKPQKGRASRGPEKKRKEKKKEKGIAPSPCAVTPAKCRRYRGTLSCEVRASEGGGHSPWSDTGV